MPRRYTTDSSYKQFEQMRVAMEPLTYQFGVDFFFYGHVGTSHPPASTVCIHVLARQHHQLHPSRLGMLPEHCCGLQARSAQQQCVATPSAT